jgi:hypothetical protein
MMHEKRNLDYKMGYCFDRTFRLSPNPIMLQWFTHLIRVDDLVVPEPLSENG